MNEIPDRKTWLQRLQLWAEGALLGRFAVERPRGWLKAFLKTPIFMWKIGLGGLVGPYYLLLTTRGRKSGKWRDTPLDFSRHKISGDPVIISGWGEQSDWVKNVRANPQVKVHIGWQAYNATAVPLGLEETADVIEEYVGYAPPMKKIFEARAGRLLDGTRQEYLRCAEFYPSFRLVKEVR